MVKRTVTLTTYKEDYGDRDQMQVFELRIPLINILELGGEGGNLIKMTEETINKSKSIPMVLRTLALLIQEIERQQGL